MSTSPRLPVALAGAIFYSFLAFPISAALAAELPQQAVTAIPISHSQVSGWHVAESANFRFYHHSQPEVAVRLAAVCEKSRHAIRQRWLGNNGQSAWTIKCDVYLYPTRQEFERKTRYPADSWGFADLEIGQGQVWMRRLDMRSDVESRLIAVAIHELTHVVLADRFAHRQIPRWADEGIALNSEPPQRQQDMRRWLAGEVRQGRGFKLTQLLAMQQYPTDKHLGDLFYAQSGSLIEFLLQQNSDSEEGVMRLVESAQHQVLEQPLQGVSVARLESEWKAWLLKSEASSEPRMQLAADRP